MVFIEKQRHGNQDYYYLVKSVRLSATKVRKIRVFLGRKIPAHEELQTFFRELDAKTPKPFKPKLLSLEVVDRLEDLCAATAIHRKTAKSVEPPDFLVRFTYNTNAIEGNPLTLRQTALILAEGITPQGAKTDNVLEVLNSKDAWEFLKAYKGPFNESFIRKIQYEVTKNTSCRLQGTYRDNAVGITGTDFRPPTPSKVPSHMKQLVTNFNKTKKTTHPVELAGRTHNTLVQVHPFTDGNGRTARLLMNWVLMKNRFPPVIIQAQNKENYYNAIEASDQRNEKPFATFLAEQLIQQYTVLKEKETKMRQ